MNWSCWISMLAMKTPSSTGQRTPMPWSSWCRMRSFSRSSSRKSNPEKRTPSSTPLLWCLDMSGLTLRMSVLAMLYWSTTSREGWTLSCYITSSVIVSSSMTSVGKIRAIRMNHYIRKYLNGKSQTHPDRDKTFAQKAMKQQLSTRIENETKSAYVEFLEP